MPMSKEFDRTDATTLRRHPERGSYDRATVHAILDEGLVAHVGFVHEGRPVVVPMVYGRVDDAVVLHSSRASRAGAMLTSGEPLCLTVTLVDGLVLARSAMHHSMNYRSVMLFGHASEVQDPDEKARLLRAVVDHVMPGRTRACRVPDEREVAATRVLTVPLREVSAKVRTGGPVDSPDDLALPWWAGVVPLRLCADPLVAEPGLPDGARAPEVVRSGLSPR